MSPKEYCELFDVMSFFNRGSKSEHDYLEEMAKKTEDYLVSIGYVRSETPDAWVVDCPVGFECDTRVYCEESRAIEKAYSYAEDGDGEWFVYPLFRGIPQLIEVED